MQESWRALQQQSSATSSQDGAMLLQVIANAASNFPETRSASLCDELLKVDRELPAVV